MVKANWDEIKEGIQKEVKGKFTENTIDTFLEVLKISNRQDKSNNLSQLRRGLETRYIGKQIDQAPEALKDMANDTEGFFKNIYELSSPNDIPVGTLGSLFNRFFKDINLSRADKDDFFEKTDEHNPTKEPEYFSNKMDGYGASLKSMYDFRNAFSHKKESIIYPRFTKKLNDELESITDIKSMVLAYLAITKQYETTLKSKIKSLYAVDISPYLEAVRDNFISRFEQYIQIRSEEDLKLSRNIQEKILPKGEENNPKRTGTIEELRSNNTITENQLLIWADAGMGKSTTLQYLAYIDAKRKLKDKKKNLPIFIEMGLLIEPKQSLKQYLLKEIEKYVSVGEEFIENELKEGNINLFIDAINETPSDVKTQRMKEIDALLKDYPNNFTIISSRSSDNPFGNMPVFVLQKMNDQELEEFLLKNTKGKPEVAGKIKNAMETDAHLKGILRQYFMFSKLIEIVKDTGKVPDGEGAIVHEFIQALYDREYIEKKDDGFNSRNRKNIDKLLANLGYNILEKKKEENPLFSENEALNYFQEAKDKYGFNLDLPYVLDICKQLKIFEYIEEKQRFTHSIYLKHFHSLQEDIILGI